jgi:dTDP-4-dehydrorhamnose reductase
MQVQQLFEAEQPDVVVHAAAMTQVDDCELQHEKCFEVNVQGTSQILVDAELVCKHFIYVSTDFVFDGEKGNYTEEDEASPLSWYGFTKLQAEAVVESSTIPWAIVRTCLVYGETVDGTRSNIITWTKKNLEEGKPIKVVNDQVRTPTYVVDLAKGILLVIEKKATGIFHIAGKDILTPYQMALATASHCGLSKTLIEEVTAATFTQPAKRPPLTGFDITKAKNELGYAPLSFEEGLQAMLAK